MTEPVLAATGLSRAFGGVPAVEDVSLEVPPSAMVAVVGPNGSGKTTLLRLVVGLLSPDAGRVASPAGVDHPGYLPQHPSFHPRFTVRETVSFYARLAGAPPGAAEEAIATVGLGEAADRRVAALSGGMVRLLGIAQAIVSDSAAIVLDEPATGLDPGMRQHIFETLADRRDGGDGVLVASHDLSLVEAHADRVVLLEAGRVVAQGSVQTVLDRFEATSLASAFEAAMAGDPATVTTGEGSG